MSKLDDLINKFCPNGVEYKTLGEVIFSLNTGLNPRKFFRLNTDDAQNYYVTIREMVNGKIIFTDSTDRINDEALRLCNNRSNLEKGDVLFSGTGTIGRTVVIEEDPENWNIKEGVYTIKPNQSLINSKYLSYLLQSDEIKRSYMKKVAGGTVQSIPMGDLRNQTIPVPPLEVQNEIVRILDKFTSLEAELEARRKQYKYYRDSLLTFGDDVEWKTIGELFDFKNGLNKDKSAFGNGIPFVKYTDVYNNKKIIKELLTGKVQLNEKEIESFGVHKGDVLFTRCSETKEEVGFASAVTEDLGDCAFNGFVLRARPKTDLLLPDYCAYCFRTFYVRKEIIRTCSFTTRANTTGVILSKIKIPVPSLEKQKQIASILDRFDTLCNNITSGIPAEIEARHKQYEYYRDKLLTFKRKEA